MLVDLTSRGVSGDVAAKALEQAGLAVNKNQIPFDRRPPEAPSGLRLSAHAGSARGFGVAEFRPLGSWGDPALRTPAEGEPNAPLSGADNRKAACRETKC